MMLPFRVKTGLTKNTCDRWQKQFSNPHRKAIEGLWRRTQDIRNKDLSDWKTSGDMRRRMLQYYDEYEIIEEPNNSYSFCLTKPYIWLHLCFPKEEIASYENKIQASLNKGDWKGEKEGLYSKEDLFLQIDKFQKHPEDTKKKRVFPKDYCIRELALFSKNGKIPPDVGRHPWEVLRTGIRTKDIRGNPKRIKKLTELTKYLPLQVELGCGPSIEAGIPPLHYLHELYSITDRQTGKFILSPKKDHFVRNLLENPEKFYTEASIPLSSALSAPLTKFFKLLLFLKKTGGLVEPIITNNFDGLTSLYGFKEMYIRKYAETHITPKIEFNPKARGFLVVGSHADRRRIQHSAREQGLQIIYVDPEGYYSKGGRFTKYPLESVQDEDILISMCAEEFATKWEEDFEFVLDEKT